MTDQNQNMTAPAQSAAREEAMPREEVLIHGVKNANELLTLESLAAGARESRWRVRFRWAVGCAVVLGVAGVWYARAEMDRAQAQLGEAKLALMRMEVATEKDLAAAEAHRNLAEQRAAFLEERVEGVTAKLVEVERNTAHAFRLNSNEVFFGDKLIARRLHGGGARLVKASGIPASDLADPGAAQWPELTDDNGVFFTEINAPGTGIVGKNGYLVKLNSDGSTLFVPFVNGCRLGAGFNLEPTGELRFVAFFVTSGKPGATITNGEFHVFHDRKWAQLTEERGVLEDGTVWDKAHLEGLLAEKKWMEAVYYLNSFCLPSRWFKALDGLEKSKVPWAEGYFAQIKRVVGGHKGGQLDRAYYDEFNREAVRRKREQMMKEKSLGNSGGGRIMVS